MFKLDLFTKFMIVLFGFILMTVMFFASAHNSKNLCELGCKSVDLKPISSPFSCDCKTNFSIESTDFKDFDGSMSFIPNLTQIG